MNPIRPTTLPPTPQAAPSDASKLAAQKAFFAMISGQAPPVAAVAQTPVTAASTPVARAAATPAEGPQKVPRPGSLFDIRV